MFGKGHREISVFSSIAGGFSAIAVVAVGFVAHAVVTVDRPSPTDTSAHKIVLTLENQGVTISGEFMGYAQNAYIIMTEAGILHVPATHATCEGRDCIDIVAGYAGNS